MTGNKTASTGRSLALDCFNQWSGTRRPIQVFIHRVIHQSGLKSADRHLALMLVMGVLRRQQYLDIVISRYAKTRLNRMKPLTLAALRIGVYQICFLDRIPDAAAVNETVKALKKFRQPGWLIRFVNATLRTIAREKERLPRPETAGPGNSPLLEHPEWLTEKWSTQYGRQTMEEICRINALEPELCLQVIPGKLHRVSDLFAQAGITARPGLYAPESLILPGYRGSIPSLPGFAEGFFQVQDQAAQLACLLLMPLREGGRYLDGCAGLGGKTCTIASMLPKGATLCAVEPDPRRFRLLTENLQRRKPAELVSTVQQDLQRFAASGPSLFDGILLDVPCSGTGVIRKHPDIRWNRCRSELAGYQTKQLELLRIAASLLAPGGVLVYATCSLEPEENEQVVERFLAATEDFDITDCRPCLPEGAAALVDGRGFFRPLPGEEIEGFFAARLQRRGGA